MGPLSSVDVVADATVQLTEDVATRFDSHIEKLQEFFANRALHFGVREDIFALAERLSNSGAFHAEMTSMLRAIIFSENERVTQAELLDIITIASGGSEFDVTDPEVNRPVRQLLAFVGWVVRSLWKRFPEEAALNSGSANAGFAAMTANPVADLDIPAGVTTPLTNARTHAVEEASVASSASGHASQQADSQQRLPSARRSVNPPMWSPSDSPLDQGSSSSVYSSLDLFSTQRKPFLVVGLLGTCLGLALGFWLHDRPLAYRVPAEAHLRTPDGTLGGSQPEDAPVISPQRNSAMLDVPVRSMSKPSPYGPPLENLSSRGRVVSTAQPKSPAHGSLPSHSRQSRDVQAATTKPPYVEAANDALPERAVATSLEPSSRFSGTARVGSLDAAGSPTSSRREEVPSYPHQSVFLSASGAMAANLLAAPSPAYPEAVVAAGVQGKVIVQAVVGTDGGVITARVLSGPPSLRETALSAVRRWHYRPYLIDGRPTAVATNATLDFRLYP